jgi:hypothetical protein
MKSANLRIIYVAKLNGEATGYVAYILMTSRMLGSALAFQFSSSRPRGFFSLHADY